MLPDDEKMPEQSIARRLLDYVEMPPPFRLSDDAEAAIIAIRDQDESAWRQLGHIAKEQVEQKPSRIPKKAIEQRIANLRGVKASTIGQYRRYVSAHGDILDEVPQLTIAQLRLAIKEARLGLQDGQKLDADMVAGVVLARTEKSADGFTIIAPDAWAAELDSGKQPRDPFKEAVLRAESNIGTAWRKMPEGWTGAQKLSEAARIVEELARELEGE